MDGNAASTSNIQKLKSTNQKTKQLKKTKALPIIKQTKTSMIRMAQANPLLFLHEKSKEEKIKLAGIHVPKSFDFQKTEEFIKAAYGIFQRIIPMKNTSLSNLKGKTASTTSIDKLPQKPKPNEQKNGKILKSNKDVVKYYKSNNNNVNNLKKRRNLKENVNNKQMQKGTKPIKNGLRQITNKENKFQEKWLSDDKFDTEFMSDSVSNNPSSSSNISIFSPIEKEANYITTNLKALNRTKRVFFSTPVVPK